MTHLDSTWKFRLPQLPLGKDGLHSGSKGPIKKPHPRLIRHPSHHFFFFAGASSGLHTSNIYQHLTMLDDLLISCKQPSSMNNHTHTYIYILISIYLYIYLSLSLSGFSPTAHCGWSNPSVWCGAPHPLPHTTHALGDLSHWVCSKCKYKKKKGVSFSHSYSPKHGVKK